LCSVGAMAVGKNKRLSKGGKKGQKKKIQDVMTRKEWYDVVAPACFSKRQCAKTLANKTQGNKLAADNLKGRVVEISLADLMDEEQTDYAHRKIALKVDDVQGRSCITNFYGMDLTRDRLCSLIKKWCTLIEAQLDVKTSDGYVIRVFIIGFTNRRGGQVKKNCYAQTAQVRRIRQRMFAILRQHIAKSTLLEAVKKFQLEVIGKEIQKKASGIYPLRDVTVRKVKIIKAPKVDVSKLMEAHGGDIPASREEIGTATA